MPVLVTIKVFCDNVDGLSGLGEFLSERQPVKNGEAETELASNDVKQIE